MSQDDECPICYISYGEQSNGEIICKDGKANSEHRDICNHYICFPCCWKLRNQSIQEESFVKCPLCREDWTDWIMSHYYTSDEDSDDEEYDDDE